MTWLQLFTTLVPALVYCSCAGMLVYAILLLIPLAG